MSHDVYVIHFTCHKSLQSQSLDRQMTRIESRVSSPSVRGSRRKWNHNKLEITWVVELKLKWLKWKTNEKWKYSNFLVSAADTAVFGLAGVTPDSGYTGRVPESTDEGNDVDDKSEDGGGVAVVGLTPGPIRTEGELVCMVRIVKHHNVDPPPFEVRALSTQNSRRLFHTNRPSGKTSKASFPEGRFTFL